MSGYADEAAAGAGRSRAVFDAVVAELADPECAQVTHAELEERLTERSRELMRQLFQDHVDVRAVREERRTGVVGADQVPDEVLAVADQFVDEGVPSDMRGDPLIQPGRGGGEHVGGAPSSTGDTRWFARCCW